ncbi:MAG TPA: phosphatidylglycerol lysyltransferase domain-containing protein, partial [Polyangia bacterium]
TGKAWVAAGAPLADDAHLAAVARAFVDAAAAAGRRACFFATEQRFVDVAGLRALLIGEQGVWNPFDWDAIVAQSRNLREQLRRARAKGVTVREYDPAAATPGGAPEGPGPSRAAVEAVVERWRRMQELAPMGFLARVDPLSLGSGGELFVALVGSSVVGVLAVVPVHGRDGWLFQTLLRAPEAPNGTAEALVDTAMRAARAQGRTFVTLGLAPLAGEVRGPLRLARSAGGSLYNFEGLRAFKAKLRPERWDPVYLSFPPEISSARAILDALGAFAHGKLLTFGLRTLARGPTVLVKLLAVLLVPWTILLASSSTARWFPNATVKWVWVAFDVALAAGLRSLWRRWSRHLAWGLTLAIGADAALTAIEAVWWNGPRTHGVGPHLVLAAAVCGPLGASLLLGGLTVRRESVTLRRTTPSSAADRPGKE